MTFNKSDMGAQASWKGYSSQTLYIASRIIEEQDTFEYYPEQLEDLMIKENGSVTEVVQVKDLSSLLSMSDLASTDASQRNEGFFRRVLSLRGADDHRIVAKVVHFGLLGEELNGLSENDVKCKAKVKRKLVSNHGFSDQDAEWVINQIVFEKVEIENLRSQINKQINSYIPTMIAPNLAQDLLIQYVSDLSKSKGFTSKSIWQNKLHLIGKDMASLDGYFREYGGSLIQLVDLVSSKSNDDLKGEFLQGVSVQPSHIRLNLDFERETWLQRIENAFKQNDVVVINGVSGQGKNALCYRYLMKNFYEESVFCVRQINSAEQAENLAKAIIGLSKHSPKFALYIDVNPGEKHWAWLLRELQVRSVKLPILVSIREEDLKQANIDKSEVSFQLLTLSLSKEEASKIFDTLTLQRPHKIFRSFEEAWQHFGEVGPFLEFIYMLNNNETLGQRLNSQIGRLIDQCPDDSWLDLLKLVSYAGKIGCAVSLLEAGQEVHCKSITAALKRMSDEYLIRSSEDGRFIEALHPLRAQIIYSVLQTNMVFNEEDLLLQGLRCVESIHLRMLLLHYFTNNDVNQVPIEKIANVNFKDWVAYASVLHMMLWLDVKLYLETNKLVYERLINERGLGWISFAPLDITGVLKPGTFIAESLIDINPQIKPYLDEIKTAFKGFSISYSSTNEWLSLATAPEHLPLDDLEWSSFGYALFWLAIRGVSIALPFSDDKVIAAMNIGQIDSKINALQGIFKQGYIDIYNRCEVILKERLIKENNVVWMELSESTVDCGFIPPLLREGTDVEKHSSINNFWTMSMVKLLSRLYPSKETIKVRLVGIDLWKNLGINSYDYEKSISRENNFDQRITELNSWITKHAEFIHRPNDWDEYLKLVLNERKMVVETINDLIYLVERLYKKRQIDRDKAKKTEGKIQFLFSQLSKNILLPKVVVDPYGLISEGSKNDSQLLPQTSIASVQPYEQLVNAIRNTRSSFQEFLKYYFDILIARLNGQNPQESNKVDLSLINLYDASTNLRVLQKEYSKLFSAYTDEDYLIFVNTEIEAMLTLLNIWNEVVNCKPNGMSIAYEAKQRYRKSESSIKVGFQKVLDRLENEVRVFDGHDDENNEVKYLISEYESLDNTWIKAEYKHICLALRTSWSIAHSNNSQRWYLESYWPRMIYVPVYKGLPILGGLELPMYRVLDSKEEEINSFMIPVAIPDDLFRTLKVDSFSLGNWQKIISHLSRLQLYVLQYNQVYQEHIQHQTITVGLNTYLSTLLSEVSECIEALNYDQLRELQKEDYEVEIREMSKFVLECFKKAKKYVEIIDLFQQLEEAEDEIQLALNGMILLAPYLISIDR